MIAFLQIVHGIHAQGFVLFAAGVALSATLIYLLTRSKDFLIVGITAALFLLPIVFKVVR